MALRSFPRNSGKPLTPQVVHTSSEAEKLHILDQLYKFWLLNKDMRFMQMVANVIPFDEMYYMDDFDLIDKLRGRYAGRFKKV